MERNASTLDVQEVTTCGDHPETELTPKVTEGSFAHSAVMNLIMNHYNPEDKEKR